MNPAIPAVGHQDADAGPRYNPATIDAAKRLAIAEKDMKAARGTPTGLYVWMRLNHVRKLVTQQQQGIHAIHLHDGHTNEGYCTCGLVLPPDVDNPLLVGGHLEPGTEKPSTLLLGEPSPQPSEVAKRRFQVVCQSCGINTGPHRLDDAQRAICAHQHRD